MFEIHGNFTDALVFTDVIEEEAIEQIRLLCDQPFAAGAKVRIMPDVHAGAGCTIGTTMTIMDKIVPNLVGVDIGCGMLTICLGHQNISFEQLDELIYKKIPSGRTVRQAPHPNNRMIDLTELRCFSHIKHDYAKLSLGTLGGGNHFIEVDTDEDGQNFLVIHTGSRHLGVEVASFYQKAGYDALVQEPEDDLPALIEKYKREGRKSEIPGLVRTAKAKTREKKQIPPSLAYVEGDLFRNYIHDMKLVQQFARLNRKTIADELLKGLGVEETDRFETVHNYIETETMILRKGAVSAKKDERLLIPINMRDGSLICIGKGNPDWNYSAPHGAGRLFSRREAKQRFSVNEFSREMSGIYTTSVNADTLDESPMCYKNINDILDNIGPTVDVCSIIRPLYNFKAAA
jgi:RNA-splicing ligase RtcB